MILARIALPTVLILAFASTSGLAQQKFPAGPVRIIAPYVPGGAVDIVARPLADLLSQRWGSPVVVENRAGGATVVGTSVVAAAPADGHTLLLTATPFVVNPTLLPSLPYDSLRDFAGVSMVVEQPLALVANPLVPANTLKELVAYAKKSEHPLAYGSSGIGGISHLFGELFARTAGIKLLHVPYRGSGAAVVDLLAGNIPLLFDSGYSAKSNTYFLNFGPSREALTAVIFGSVTDLFEKNKQSPKNFENRDVELTGFIKDHPQYGLEVILEHPKQIRLVD